MIRREGFRLKVLLVDDHRVVRDGTQLWIEGIDSNAKVVHARNAAECVERLGKEAFDLVFLDLGLPDRPGLEILEELKANHPGLPVVVVSAASDDATVLEAIRLGAMGFVPKTAEDPEMLRGCYLRALQGEVTLPASVIDSQPQRATPLDTKGVSPRQLDVLRHLVRGMANKEIARALGISPMTVRDYVSDLLATFGVKNRVQLVIEVGRLKLPLR
jgi:DNA-binding NarL/FixJ family response regulator